MLAITERWVCCDHPECAKLPSDECARRPGEEGVKRPREECAEHHKTEKRVKASEKRVTIKRPKIKILSTRQGGKREVPARRGQAYQTVQRAPDSTKLKEETLASLSVYWDALDGGEFTVDDHHEAEANIAVLVEKFRHGPNRYIAENFLL